MSHECWHGGYAAVGPVAGLVAGFFDNEDPHYRGQANTTPAASEVTTRERVEARLKYPVAPALGVNYSVGIGWKYERTTTGAAHQYGVEREVKENIHYLRSYEVNVPDLHDRKSGPLRICARFQKPDGKYFTGPQLYVFGVLVSTYGATRMFQMTDDGADPDEKPNDGWYCGAYLFDRRSIIRPVEPDPSADLPGDWYVFVFAQDVNTIPDDTDPVEAAKVVGGVILTSQMKLSFDQPCTLEHDGVVRVI